MGFGYTVFRSSGDRFPMASSAVHPISLLSAAIPIGDDVVHIADENGVVREVEQACLLGSFRHFRGQPVPRAAEFLFHGAANRAEPRDQRGERREDYEIR